MRLSKEIIKILGLSEYEISILKHLKERDLMIADLSIVTEIPRTSLYYSLPLLEERGLIKSYRNNKKTFWKNIQEEALEKTFGKKENKINNNHKSAHNTTNVEISDSAKISISKAIDSLKDIVGNAYPNSRFYGIQPEASIVGAIEKSNIDEIIDFNKKVKDKKLIVEGVIHESGTTSMVKSLSATDKKRLLASFSGRTADTVKLPEGFLNNTKSEIYLYEHKKIALVNWYENFSVIIENKDVYDLLMEMFRSTKYMLKKYDQNEKIARKLVELTESDKIKK